MSRTVEVIVSPEHTSPLVARIRALPHVLAIKLQSSQSLQPPGDVLTVELANRSLQSLMHVLREHRDAHPETVVVSHVPDMVIVPQPESQVLQGDHSEATFEEMDTAIARESNMTLNAMLIMAGSGALAAVGFSERALYLVIAAMILAPGFEPLSRIGLGIAGGSAVWKRGLRDVLVGYLALVAGALLTALLLRALGGALAPPREWWLSPGSTVHYWNELGFAALFSSAVAAVIGAMLIVTHRSVLTAGVMITLALVPAAAGIGVGIAGLDAALVGRSALRLLVEFGLVWLGGLLVFAWKRVATQRRPMLS